MRASVRDLFACFPVLPFVVSCERAGACAYAYVIIVMMGGQARDYYFYLAASP